MSISYLCLLARAIKKGSEVDFQNIELLDKEVPIEGRLHYQFLIDLVDSEVENLPDKCKLVFKNEQRTTSIKKANSLTIRDFGIYSRKASK